MNEDNHDEFRTHVEQLLCEAFGLDHLEVDDDGDWPFVKEGRSVFAQVVAEPDLNVHVFSRIATGVSGDALPEINELNLTMTWAKLVRTDDGEVFAAQRIHWSGVSAEVAQGCVFVFGSGKAAHHNGGAARLARERFGAERGVGEGLRGQSYAIPTMAGFGVLEKAVAKFIRFAGEQPELEFYVTRVGCGHASFEEAKVAALFATAPSNVIKPEGW